jgi:hypothetical protein
MAEAAISPLMTFPNFLRNERNLGVVDEGSALDQVQRTGASRRLSP